MSNTNKIAAMIADHKWLNTFEKAALAEIITAAINAGEARGAAAERANVVAILNSLLSKSREINERLFLSCIIERIERGDHARPEPIRQEDGRHG